jgi:hypothetical protein
MFAREALVVGGTVSLDGKPYRVITEVGVPPIDHWLFFLIVGTDGEELLVECYAGTLNDTYTLLLPATLAAPVEMLYYAMTFEPHGGTPRWLRGTLPCGHGSDGQPFQIAGRVFMPRALQLQDGVLFDDDEREGRGIRPASRDPNVADKIYLPDGGGLVAFRSAEAALAANPVVWDEVEDAGGDGEAAVRIQVLEIRPGPGGREEYLIALEDGQRWCPTNELAADIVAGTTAYFEVDGAGAESTYRVFLQPDGTWIVQAYADAELDPDTTIVFAE